MPLEKDAGSIGIFNYCLYNAWKLECWVLQDEHGICYEWGEEHRARDASARACSLKRQSLDLRLWHWAWVSATKKAGSEYAPWGTGYCTHHHFEQCLSEVLRMLVSWNLYAIINWSLFFKNRIAEATPATLTSRTPTIEAIIPSETRSRLPLSANLGLILFKVTWR